MKTAFLIFAALLLLATLKSEAALPPTTLKSQNGTKATVFNFEVPNNQATKTTTGSLIETGNNNLLANPSFEAPLASSSGIPGWTSSGTMVFTQSSTAAFHGSKYVSGLVVSGALNVYQDSSLNAVAFANGVNGTRSIALRTATAYTSTMAIYFCARREGALIVASNGTEITNCKKLTNNDKWHEYVYPSQLGATSNGIAVVSLNPTTGEVVDAVGALVFFDKAEVSQTNRVGIAPVVTDWIDFVPSSITGFTAGYTVNIAKYRRVGSNAEINMRITMNGNFNAAVRIPPPPTLVFDFSKFYSGGAASLVSSTSSNTYTGVLTNDLGGNLLISSAANSGSGYWSTGVPRSVIAGDVVSINVSIPILGWSSSTSYLADSASSFSTNTNPLYFKATAITDSDPVGTFNTFSYGANNTPTLCTTPPSQPIADMQTNGIKVFAKAYTVTSNCTTNIARVEVKLGKGLETATTSLYKNTGKSVAMSSDSTVYSVYESGAAVKDYSPSTGIYVFDVGRKSLPDNTSAFFWSSDNTTPTSGYLVINAQKAKDTMVADLSQMKAVAARAVSTSGQSIPHNTNTTIVFNSKIFDSANSYNPATGTYTVPETGYYLVSAGITIGTTGPVSAEISIVLQVNGNTRSLLGRTTIPTATSVNTSATGSAIVELIKGDQVTISGYQSIGSAKPLIVNAENNFFSIAKVGAGTP